MSGTCCEGIIVCTIIVDMGIVDEDIEGDGKIDATGVINSDII